jgi:methionine synthase II (cobalamin-independent)
MCDNNIVASSGGFGQVYGLSYFNYESGSELNLIEYVSHDYTTGKKVIQHSSGKILTEEEAAEIQEKYIEFALELIEL